MLAKIRVIRVGRLPAVRISLASSAGSYQRCRCRRDFPREVPWKREESLETVGPERREGERDAPEGPGLVHQPPLDPGRPLRFHEPFLIFE